MNKGCLFALVAAGTTIGSLALWLCLDLDFYDRYAPALQRELGFQHGSPYARLRGGGCTEEVMTLHPVKDGPMYRAGARDGDIVPDGQIIGFYRRLEAARGSQIRFRVVAGGFEPPPGGRQERVISLTVPPRHGPL